MRTFLIATAVLAAWATFAAPVAACSVTGYANLGEAATKSVAIVEADVLTAYQGGGYEVRVRRVLKGELSAGRIIIGRRPADATGGDCGGQISLVPSDHVILAFGRLDHILAFETAVWWIEPNGSVRRTNLVPNDQPTTREDVWRALRLSLPDTDTAASPNVPRHGDDDSPLPWFAGAAATLLLYRRFGGRSIGLGTNDTSGG